MNKIYKFIIVLLIVIIAISSIYLIKEVLEQNKESEIYNELQESIENTEKNNIDEEVANNLSENVEKSQNKKNNEEIRLEDLYKKNNDLVGWIRIDGTNINYPVMQSNLENGNYYLHRNFYKQKSSIGIPLLASNCNVDNSSNLIIYGHNIKSGLMFANLIKYKDYNFYKNHKYIKFYTLSKDKSKTIESTYEIIFFFKTIAYSDDGFKYYNYTNFQNEKNYSDFVKKCRNLQFYDTNVESNYKDKFITLSTCEYSKKNGRMVVVAKKIE